jgi:DNA-binding CsgD family transcriptional regulator
LLRGGQEGWAISGLLDRASETSVLEGVLAAVRDGLSGVLVVRGEAGIGKTALLEWAAGQAGDMQVARVAGVQAEMQMGFAGLHRLLIPFLGGLDGLPGPQRQALGSAFGLADGPPPDRFLVGLAALTLLTDAAAERPLLCLVDDAHWLDQVSVEMLGFIARRLHADWAGMLFTVREGEEGAAALAGLPELRVGGLADEVAHELLAISAGAQVDGQVSRQIVAGSAGNPLALAELADELTPAELAGAVPLSWPLRFGGRLEELYLSRVRALPADTRALLLVAAAEPSGDPSLVAKAAGQLGIHPEAGEAAGTRRLVSWEPQVRFRHPLIRSAAYYAAPAAARQRAHTALAAVTDPDADPDWRAWHLAEAAAGPDEQVAAELERSADRAQARGGWASGAAFLERAMVLTPDPARRAQRALASAQAKVQAGAFDAVPDLLGAAQAGPLDELGRARVDLLRAQVAYAQNRGSDAPPLLLRAARQLEPLDLRLARVTYLDALSAAMFAGSSAGGVGVVEVARAVLAAPRPSGRPRPLDLLLEGVAMQCTEGYAAGVPMLKRALSALRSEEFSAEERLECSLLSYGSAVDLWDDESWYVLASRNIKLARESGALAVLHFGLNARIVADAFMGEPAAGSLLMAELRAVCEATGSYLPPYGPLALAAWRGQEAEVPELVEATTKEVLDRGETLGLSAAQWANAVFYNGLGRYEEALAAAERAGEHRDIGFSDWSLAEVILSAVRCGKPERAADALRQLAARARDCGSDWALGIEARSRALLSEGDDAECQYRESIARLSRTRIRAELARAHLQYGEWLRGQRRRSHARDQLRTAFEMFDAMGMEAFAGLARAELRATGERARPRSPDAPGVLTAQEAQIARLVAGHLSNREIAARLFISASTVEYHLRKIFRKLDVTTRAELARTLLLDKKTPKQRDAEEG